MAKRQGQDAVDGIEYSIYCTYAMSNVGYVDIIKVLLFKVTSDTFIKSMYSIYLSGQRFVCM